MSEGDAPIDWTGQKQVSLALQGGGSHGAFTWGILDASLRTSDSM
jgi:NTE family protein